MWTKIRLRSVWAMVPLYLLFARPSLATLLAGLALALAGILIRAWAATAIRKNRVLTTHGPYAYTRNPLYLGSFLIGLGFGIASGLLWMLALFLVFFALVYGRTMRKEERRLASLFGEEFDRYQRTVPRFLPRPAARSDVVGETARGRSATDPHRPADARAVAVLEEPVSTATRRAQLPPLRRYLATREYEALLGVAVMYVALVIKLVL